MTIAQPDIIATGAPIGVWTNGQKISRYNRKDPNYFEDITDIPNVNQSLADILTGRFTLKDLITKDKVANEGSPRGIRPRKNRMPAANHPDEDHMHRSARAVGPDTSPPGHARR